MSTFDIYDFTFYKLMLEYLYNLINSIRKEKCKTLFLIQ